MTNGYGGVFLGGNRGGVIRTPRITISMNLLELERCREVEMALDQDVVSSVVVLSFS